MEVGRRLDNLCSCAHWRSVGLQGLWCFTVLLPDFDCSFKLRFNSPGIPLLESLVPSRDDFWVPEGTSPQVRWVRGAALADFGCPLR